MADMYKNQLQELAQRSCWFSQQGREPRRGSSQRPTVWVSPAWVSGRRGMGLFLVCCWFVGNFSFSFGVDELIFIFCMFVKWMMWQIMSGCYKRGGLRSNLTIGALIINIDTKLPNTHYCSINN